MSTLDVALRLRLINQLTGPANKVEKDLRDVDQAVRRLNGARGGQRLAGDLNRVAGEANKADAAMRKLDQSARRLRDTRGRFAGGTGLGGVSGGGVRAGAMAGAEEAAAASGASPLLYGLAGRGLGAAGGAAALGVAGVAAALGGAIKSAMSFEDAMAEVRKAVDLSDTEFAGLEQTILRISRETPLAKEEIAKLVAQAGFAGRPIQDLARFGTHAAKAAVAFGLSAEESGDRLAKLGNVFQLSQERIEALADAVNYLGDNMAAKEADIMEFLGRVGGQARIFGLSEAQTAAFGSAILSLGVSSEVASTGFNALMTKLGTASKQSKAFQGGLKALGLSSKQLSRMIAEGPAEAIVEVFRRIKKLAPEKQMAVLTDMMGLEYADDAARMAQSLDLIIQALDMINDPSRSKGSVDRAFSIFDELTSSKLTKVGNQFAALGVNIGKWLTPAIRVAADAASWLLEKINGAFERSADIGEIAAKAISAVQGAIDAASAGAKKVAEIVSNLGGSPAGQKDHPILGAVQRQLALERELAADEAAAGKGDIGAQQRVLNLRAQLNQIRSEIEAALKVPGAAEAASQSMEAVAKAIGAEGEQAVEEARAISERIRALFNFTATPTISPQFAPAGGATLKDGSPVPLPPKKPQRTGAIGGDRSFAQANTFNIYGDNPQRTARAIDRRLARLGSGAGALTDRVG
ncbi:phage tail tape measure protein [Ancylobacter sp. TS-1]|uniref:phage tail tape measure protein n=1 Tax=Ancylobacter sp. TS-1 TaxID=1850374 RepID=UPI001265D22B|nr:phage tail tape measure protein [Ancylobacter sp. TS-1]QFR32369.1 phage tail tape measure protein [Ancylobacter sp. TS-1]